VLLRPLAYTVVKYLYLYRGFTPGIAPTLQRLVLSSPAPGLRSIYLEALHPSGHVLEAIWPFVAARLLSGHAIPLTFGFVYVLPIILLQYPPFGSWGISHVYLNVTMAELQLYDIVL
jgi:hypothetical protein